MSALGQGAEEIAKEYRTKAALACEKIDATFRREGAAIAAKQVSQGDTKAAALISEQIEAKVKGEAVSEPHRAISALLVQYDSARQTALRPIRAFSVQRLDALLKTSAAKDMSVVLKIAKTREEIEGGKLAEREQTSMPKHRFPMEWGYYLQPERQVICGKVILQADGSLIIAGGFNFSQTSSGKWKATDNPAVLETEMDAGEKGTITINGDEAEFVRTGVGSRYLKAMSFSTPTSRKERAKK